MKLPKIRKNARGMTLVEVVVAMAIFSIETLAICMAFAAALRFNARNMLRDKELAQQQAAVERKNASDVALVSGTSLEGTDIIFKSGTEEISKVSGVTEFKAVKTAYTGNTYNFEIKSFSSTGLQPMGLVWEDDDRKYKISIVNQSGVPVDVQLEKLSGLFYQGDIGLDDGNSTGVCYKHSSSVYKKTLDALGTAAASSEDEAIPSQLILGLYEPDLSAAESQLHIRMTGDGINKSIDLNNASIKAMPHRTLKIVIGNDKNISQQYE